jgi:FkbM family methyltransferase
MQFPSLLKKLVLAALPETIIYYFKIIYYPYKLRRMVISVEPELSLIRKFLAENDLVVDVGANIGLYTKFMSDFVGEGGRVLSLEPMPQTFSLLESNVKKLHLDNVHCFQYAASDRADTLLMSVPNYTDGGKNYYMAKVVGTETSSGTGTETEVPAASLDQLLEPFAADIKFIKCDVEGHELFCLKGACHILRTAQPIWMIEVSGNPDDRMSGAYQLIEFMGEFGYKVFLLDRNDIRPRKPGDRAVNYWFFGDKHIADFEVWGLNRHP